MRKEKEWDIMSIKKEDPLVSIQVTMTIVTPW